MMQVPTVQNPQAYVAAQTSGTTSPSYNAVKIDVHNPQVNAPGSQAIPTYAQSAYNVPQASIYEVPQQSVYGPQQNFNQPPTAQEVPSTPAPQPVIVPPSVTTQPAAPAPAPQTPVVEAPKVATPQVDVNAFLARLTNENFDEQANAMESIADMAQNQPQKAKELLDVKVIEALLGIMGKDSSKLAGPTPKQLELREKIVNKQPVSEAESKEANTITPMEQAERNKQYAMYTTAILQKLYGEEVQKLNNTVVPLTELPGAAGVVEQLKSNPNPLVRASAIDALSYIQRPEYKQDLQTLFSIAQKDQDANVKSAATKGLEKLAQLGEAPKTAESAPAQAEQAPAPVAQAAPQDKPKEAPAPAKA